MKKLVAVLFVSLFIVSFSVAQSCLEAAQANGLKVGTSPDYPPFESLDESNNIVGFDIDLINLIGEDLGIDVEVIGQSFDGLIPALIAKQIDVIAAGLTITEEREESVDFSTPYISGPNVIVTRTDTTDIAALEDLAGKSVAVQIGSAQEAIASSVEGAEVKAYNLYTDAALAVQTRQADSMILHRVVGEVFTELYPDLQIVAELGSIETGLAFHKDCPDLTQAVNGSLAKLEESGAMQELVAKWFK
jgi:polar amino acid transport system substrate-binding protein